MQQLSVYANHSFAVYRKDKGDDTIHTVWPNMKTWFQLLLITDIANVLYKMWLLLGKFRLTIL